MTSQNGFFSDFFISDRHDVDLFPGDDICGLYRWRLLHGSLVRTGAIHRYSFRKFVLVVGLCPPLLELLLKMALFFQPSHRFLGETVESDLCGFGSGVGQGCAPRSAFGLHSARGWGPGPQVIKFRFRTIATSVSLCVKEA